MILVFGGNGQLGSALVDEARGRMPLMALGRQDVDITDECTVSRVIDRWRPQLVVNAAAYNQVDMAESEPAEADLINAGGPRILAAACDAVDVPLLHVSTDFVFDGAKDTAYVEDDPVAPLGAYGRSKAAGEAAVRELCRQHVIIRTAWLFSARGHNFLRTVLKLADTLDTLRFVGDQHGSPTAAPYLAHAILTVAQSVILGSAPWGTFHFAGPTVASRWEMAEAIVAAQAAHTGHRPVVEKIAAEEFAGAARRPTNSVLDSSRFAATFGVTAGDWRAAVDEAVAETFSTRIAA